MITHQEAVDNREEGIVAAGNRAGESWKDNAATMLSSYAVVIGKPFLIEDAADWAYGHGVSWPEDGRAWGAAVRLAQKQGTIRKCGYGEARTSNLNPKVLWESALAPVSAPPLLVLDSALRFMADLNGSNWLAGAGAGYADMRQRAKVLQSRLYRAVNGEE